MRLSFYSYDLCRPYLNPQARVLRVLAGSPELSQTLRYKKKMMMWTLPPASTPSPAAPPSSESQRLESEVGYCMMTFVIRNGLSALSLGLPTYMNYVASLTKNWALPKQMEVQVGVVDIQKAP